MDAAQSRILIVRLSAIGDVVHGLPVLNALRAALPKAFLAWVVEGVAGDLLVGHSALDALVRVPRRWLKSPSEVARVRRRLRELRFDTTIDLQGLTKSAICARLSGARRRIGYGGVDGRELSTWFNTERVIAQATHVVDRNLELARPLGVERPEARFDLHETAEATRAAEQCIHVAGLSGRFAVINPGAGWPSKLWPTERFAEVARYLGTRHGLASLVVWAGDQELAWAREIVERARGAAHLSPATSLVELAAVARRGSLFLSSDTGPLHIAAAAGTPCVGLFGPVSAKRNGPYGERHKAVQVVCLTGSSRERRSAGPESMLAISVDLVCRACDDVLARTAHERCA